MPEGTKKARSGPFYTNILLSISDTVNIIIIYAYTYNSIIMLDLADLLAASLIL
jgi:hypothetical protein